MTSQARSAGDVLSPGARQFVKFCTVGVGSLILDTGTYTLLLFLHLAPALALSLAFIVGVTNSYFWNSRWTFRDRRGDARKQVPIFFATNALGLALNLVVSTLVLVAGVHYHWTHGQFTPQETLQMVLFRSADSRNGFSVPVLIAAKLCGAVVVTVWNFGASKFITFR
jgi:putative flippase GtrA